MPQETTFTCGDIEDAADFLDSRGGGTLGDAVRAMDARRSEAEAAVEKLRAELDRVRADLAVNEHHEDASLSIAEATIEKLRDELAAIRDIAYRAGPAGAPDALEAIHARAARAASQ